MRVEFISATGGRMFVDESRVNEYKAAGYLPVADVIDVNAEVVDVIKEPVTKKRITRKKGE